MTGPARQHPGASDATRYVPGPGPVASRHADIIELILADHRRIGRLCHALYDTARYDGGPRTDWMPAHMWQRLADLLVAHTKAEEEICFLPLLGTWKGASMKTRISKRHHPAKWWLEPLPLDLRDRDIMRAKRLRMPRPGQRRRARSRRTA